MAIRQKKEKLNYNVDVSVQTFYCDTVKCILMAFEMLLHLLWSPHVVNSTDLLIWGLVAEYAYQKKIPSSEVEGTVRRARRQRLCPGTDLGEGCAASKVRKSHSGLLNSGRAAELRNWGERGLGD